MAGEEGWPHALFAQHSQDFGISPLLAAPAPVNLQGVEVFGL